MTKKIILPSAWELTQYESLSLFRLNVPVRWRQKAQHLAQKRANRTGRYPSIPVYSLDSIISASFPQIVKTVRKGWREPGNPWLFATERVDLSYLPQLIKDWLREEFTWCLGEEYVDSILNTLNDDDWRWEEKRTNISLLEEPEDKNEEFRFQAIPDYITKTFLEDNTIYFQGENVAHKLEFYPVVRLNKYTELMSWPPSEINLIDEKEIKGTVFISFVIIFSLQTVPRRKQPLLYHHLSIRRWISKPLEKGLPYQGATAFVGDNRRWLDGNRQPYSFIPLRIKERGRAAKWSTAISQLLMINSDSPLPEPELLVNQPQYNWSNLNEKPEGIQIAIPYDSRHNINPPCLPGVSPRDLASLDTAIIERISNGLPLKRVGEAVQIAGNYSYWGAKTPNDDNDYLTPMFRPSLAAPAVFAKRENALGTILIVWETNLCRDELIKEICTRLYLNSQTETQIYNTPGGGEVKETVYAGEHGSICIKTMHVADLTCNFDIKAQEKQVGKQRKREKFLKERIEQIKFYLPLTKELCGAIIEIKRKPFIAEADPKIAWRIAAAQSNYLNQHIHSISARKKKTREEYIVRGGLNRVKSAVSDLFRQFAILPTPLIKPEKDEIALHTWLTSFYVLRRTRQTSVSNSASTVVLMLRVNPINGRVEVTTPAWFSDENEGWVSYPIAQQLLLKEKWEPNSYFEGTIQEIGEEKASEKIKQEQREINQFVSDCLQDCLNTPIEEERSPHVLFMAEAQNARKLLTWLQNPHVPPSVHDLPQQLNQDLTKSQKERLSIVRIRETSQNEVPVTIIKNSPGSRTNGVFKWKDVCDDSEQNIYLSIRKLLNTEQGVLKVEESRLDNGNKQAGNTKPLEIVVVYNPGIQEDTLAKFVHNLRDRNPYYSNFNTLPFPFSLAVKSKEYAIGIKDKVETEQLETEEE